MLQEFGSNQPAKASVVRREQALEVFISEQPTAAQRQAREAIMAERLENEAKERAAKAATRKEHMKRYGAPFASAAAAALVTFAFATSNEKPAVESVVTGKNEPVEHVAERLLERCGVENPTNAELRDGVWALKAQNEELNNNSGATIAEKGTILSLEC